jgi:medium-chain acyl-[acyl-carrier-protein] hydrolase
MSSHARPTSMPTPARERASLWLDSVPLGERAVADVRMRLFCIPYAGGGPWIYWPWRSYLPSSVDIRPVQLPGRGQRIREPLLTDVGQIVEAAIDDLRAWCTMPFAFFGHSLGAVVAFELSRALHERFGLRPAHLFVSGRRAPGRPASADRITWHLPEPEFRAVVCDLHATPAALVEDAEAWQLLMPILRADFQAAQTYEYRPGLPLPCPISAIGGLDDPFVGRDDLVAWREHTSGPFSVSMFPGRHLFINDARADLCHLVATRLSGSLGAPAGADR